MVGSILQKYRTSRREFKIVEPHSNTEHDMRNPQNKSYEVAYGRDRFTLNMGLSDANPN